MTAAGGVLHEEYHSPEYAKRGGAFEVVQLWVNLPARDKMTEPAYQSITDARIPKVDLPDDAGSVRVIAGRYGAAEGPAHTFTPMNVWDMRLQAGKTLSFDLPEGHTTALFVLHGAIRVGTGRVGEAEMAVMDRNGTQLGFETLQDSVLLLLGGEPLDEPIVGHGPFVMNTEDEIAQAIRDYRDGGFGHMAASA